MKKFEWVQHPNGTSTVRDSATGESMHSSVGPWEEAQSLYIAQSRLSERLSPVEPCTNPLVVYDVGMGLAANAWAAIQIRLALPPKKSPRPLRLISFESELGGLQLALEDPGHRLEFLEKARPALDVLLEKGVWRSPGGEVHWELRQGDFFENLRSEDTPHLIFYDFYAPRACPELWSVPNLSKLRAVCLDEGEGTLLLTYSAATPVRVAFLLAGFHVGYGIGTDAKLETTLASSRLQDLHRPLSETWLTKILRSDRPFPWGAHTIPDAETLLRQLRSHPQFQLDLN